MNRPIGTVLTAVVITFLVGVPAFGVQGDVSLFVGQNDFKEDRFGDAGVGKVGDVGIRSNLDFGWPITFAIDLLRSSDDSRRRFLTSNPLLLDTDVEAIELDIGLRTTFGQRRRLRPHLGAGVALIQIDVRQVQRGSLGPGAPFSDTVIDDGDSSVGYWLDAGLAYYFKRVVFGADIRYSDATAEVKGVGESEGLEIDSGGVRYGLFLGHHW